MKHQISMFRFYNVLFCKIKSLILSKCSRSFNYYLEKWYFVRCSRTSLWYIGFFSTVFFRIFSFYIAESSTRNAGTSILRRHFCNTYDCNSVVSSIRTSEWILFHIYKLIFRFLQDGITLLLTNVNHVWMSLRYIKQYLVNCEMNYFFMKKNLGKKQVLFRKNILVLLLHASISSAMLILLHSAFFFLFCPKITLLIFFSSIGDLKYSHTQKNKCSTIYKSSM